MTHEVDRYQQTDLEKLLQVLCWTLAHQVVREDTMSEEQIRDLMTQIKHNLGRHDLPERVTFLLHEEDDPIPRAHVFRTNDLQPALSVCLRAARYWAQFADEP